ncbi:hypothetical protein POTOM_059950 [Populus tomentosa]|uniref:Uncharacterized protein n=1 Tax=Populus tomentosa TaxID=118781 RepID=A0A8X7XNS4_POPTO|nr:hypothetical protein POTOM_059947 [Populus tomentosa]KAG6737068.1 hypothetical protein POTOM_059950 [Populus tomentosa]
MAHGFLFINSGSALQSSDCSFFISNGLCFFHHQRLPLQSTLHTVVETQSMLLQLILVFVIFSGFLENGNAGIMSAFIRSEWPSIDIPLDNEVFAVPKDHNAPQQVSNWNILCLKDMW